LRFLKEKIGYKMNTYAVIILITISGSYLLGLITNWLNLRHLKLELPDEFTDTYDADAYRNSQAYTRVYTRFGYITSTFNLVLVLLFWFLGGFNYLDQVIREWQLGAIGTGLIYIAVLVLLKSLLTLPFSIYSTFVIEEKFGFNKTTPRTYFLDILKGLMLGLVLGGPLLAGLLYFFQSLGSLAWVYAWAATTLFSLIVQFIAPTWIMPLFNKFTPLKAGELKEAILAFAERLKFPLKGVFVMDGSKRSSKSNAFFTGFGKNKRIVLFDTLIKKHTTGELVAVLAHEIGHYKKKHIIKSLLIGIAHSGLIFYLLSIFLTHRGLYEAFYMSHMSVYAGLIFFSMLYTPLEMILSVFQQMLSRKNEYEADRFAAKSIEHPQDMVSALKKLSRDNLSNLTPHPLYVFLNYSHPPVLQRIRAINKINSSTG
jgi:STE24 endopeptidase